jgi:hypothetical protein
MGDKSEKKAKVVPVLKQGYLWGIIYIWTSGQLVAETST